MQEVINEKGNIIFTNKKGNGKNINNSVVGFQTEFIGIENNPLPTNIILIQIIIAVPIQKIIQMFYRQQQTVENKVLPKAAEEINTKTEVSMPLI